MTLTLCHQHGFFVLVTLPHVQCVESARECRELDLNGRRQSQRVLVNVEPARNANFLLSQWSKDAEEQDGWFNPDPCVDDPASSGGLQAASPAERGAGDPEELGRPQDSACHLGLWTIPPGNSAGERHNTANARQENEEEDQASDSAGQCDQRGHPCKNVEMIDSQRKKIKCNPIYLIDMSQSYIDLHSIWIYQQNIHFFCPFTDYYLSLKNSNDKKAR